MVLRDISGSELAATIATLLDSERDQPTVVFFVEGPHPRKALWKALALREGRRTIMSGIPQGQLGPWRLEAEFRLWPSPNHARLAVPIGGEVAMNWATGMGLVGGGNGVITRWLLRTPLLRKVIERIATSVALIFRNTQWSQ